MYSAILERCKNEVEYLQSLFDANGIPYDYGFLWLTCKDLLLKSLNPTLFCRHNSCSILCWSVHGVIAQLFGPIA